MREERRERVIEERGGERNTRLGERGERGEGEMERERVREET